MDGGMNEWGGMDGGKEGRRDGGMEGAEPTCTHRLDLG